jgi:hypothetical protein
MRAHTTMTVQIQLLARTLLSQNKTSLLHFMQGEVNKLANFESCRRYIETEQSTLLQSIRQLGSLRTAEL